MSTQRKKNPFVISIRKISAILEYQGKAVISITQNLATNCSQMVRTKDMDVPKTNPVIISIQLCVNSLSNQEYAQTNHVVISMEKAHKETSQIPL